MEASLGTADGYVLARRLYDDQRQLREAWDDMHQRQIYVLFRKKQRGVMLAKKAVERKLNARFEPVRQTDAWHHIWRTACSNRQLTDI